MHDVTCFCIVLWLQVAHDTAHSFGSYIIQPKLNLLCITFLCYFQKQVRNGVLLESCGVVRDHENDIVLRKLNGTLVNSYLVSLTNVWISARKNSFASFCFPHFMWGEISVM